MKHRISVIMSVFNNEKFIKETIESVLNQTFQSFEFIITNDNSTDGSLSIINEYADKDNRIVIINNHENIGLTKSLNKMIAISSGKYIARIDGDDICELSRLEQQIEIMENNPLVDVLFTSSLLIDEKGIELCESWRPKEINKILKYLPLHNFIPHPSVLIKTELLKKYGYNEKYRTGQDQELWLRLYRDDKKFYYLDKPLIKYRINPDSVRKDSDVNIAFNIAKQCINNKSKKRAIKYLKDLKLKEKIIIIIKLIIPHKILFYKGLRSRRHRMKVQNE
ncbi:MAG TPA: glycosyl transferase [Clostridiales bacterium]|nr:glycosyl transferase [Clostridiales bacterium]